MIAEIRRKVGQGLFEFTQHAVDMGIARHITVRELREAIANAELIEDYPNDKYGPSCLLLGFTLVGRPLHIQCSHPARPRIKIVTIYQPNIELWIDFRVRREQHDD